MSHAVILNDVSKLSGVSKSNTAAIVQIIFYSTRKKSWDL